MSSEKIIELCSADEVVEDEILQATLPSGHQLAIYNVKGNYYATDDTCTHGKVSLSEDGVIEGAQVECTWHFGRFEIETGKPCGMPCTVPLRTWEIEVKDGKIWVDLSQHPDTSTNE